MNIQQYLQEFALLRHAKNFSVSQPGRNLQTLYGNDRDVLNAQIQRYLKIIQTYKTLYNEEDVIIARAPGRVDLMGAHTDYHQGCVLPMALDTDTVIVAGRRHDRNVLLRNTDVKFSPREFVLEQEIPRSEQGDWANYVKAAAQAFVRSSGLDQLSGMNVVVDGRPPFGVPLAAGLSSSSALLIATAVALREIHAIPMEPKQFARFCGEAEWYVGTRGGFMDHFTSILSQNGHALFLDCRPVKIAGQETFITENIPLPNGYDVAICNTNVTKEKSASSEYNTRVLETKIGVELLKPHFPQARYLRDIPPQTPLQQLLPVKISPHELHTLLTQEKYEELFQDQTLSVSHELKILPRCQHVLSENARVLKGCEFLKSGDMGAFGELMATSYQSIRDDFEASCPELDQMLESILRFPGTLGARIAGAGWGGCAVALVESSTASEFQAQIAREYYQKTGIRADIFLCHPGQGAGILYL